MEEKKPVLNRPTAISGKINYMDGRLSDADWEMDRMYRKVVVYRWTSDSYKNPL